MGRGLRPRRVDAAGARQPRPGDLLHLGQDLERGRVHLPAPRPRLRHQQPAGLLEHVPRVDLGGAGPRRSASARAACRSRTSTTPSSSSSRAEPGTNHPRMLSALEIAKKNGARIIAINPLREAGLTRFDNPQTPRGLSGVGTAMADLHLPVRVNGDLALFQPSARCCSSWRTRPPRRAAPARWSTSSSSGGTRRGTAPGPSTCAPSTGWPSTGRPAWTASSCARLRGCSREPPYGVLLGDGDHPAPQLGRDDQGDRQPRLRPGQHRQAGGGAVPGPRALQRPGRPDDGDLGEGPGPLPRRTARRVPLRAAARARARHGRLDPGAA